MFSKWQGFARLTLIALLAFGGVVNAQEADLDPDIAQTVRITHGDGGDFITGFDVVYSALLQAEANQYSDVTEYAITGFITFRQEGNYVLLISTPDGSLNTDFALDTDSDCLNIFQENITSFGRLILVGIIADCGNQLVSYALFTDSELVMFMVLFEEQVTS